MKYMGSKNRHSKELLEIILKDRKPGQWYVEPFVGGANIIDKVENPRLGNDNHYYLIALLKAIQKGWEPPDEVTELTYNTFRTLYPNVSIGHPDAAMIGYIGFALSYGGKWFGGYRRDKVGKRNYSLEAKRNLLKQAPSLVGIDFRCGDYRELSIPAGSLIYNDPPYFGTTTYDSNWLEVKYFWDWVREISKDNQVFTSEYNAPEDFDCVWSKKVNNTLTKDTGSKQGTEKLFVYRGN
jgi:DNA adenine methylase